MASFPVVLAVPERVLVQRDADLVTGRTAGGDIGFMAGHEDYIGAVVTGVVTIHSAGHSAGPSAGHSAGQGGGQAGEAKLVVAVHGGFVEVSGGRLTILAPAAELAADIDLDRAERAMHASEGAEPGSPAAEAGERAAVRLEAGRSSRQSP